MPSGIASSDRSSGSRCMITTASSARLVLANATMLPNRTISGSFSNWGAPPDSVITSAIDTLLITAAANVAAKAANQATGSGVTVTSASNRTINRDTAATHRKLARLKAVLISRWRRWTRSAAPQPINIAARYSVGDNEKKPITAGNSLSENA